MTIIIKNGTIVTVNESDDVLFGASIAIRDDRIAEISDDAGIESRYPVSEVVDATGLVVMPGLANVHTHFHTTISRGVFEDLSPPNRPPFTPGIAPIPRPTLSSEEKIIMSQLGVLEAIRSGTTLALEDGTNVMSYAGSVVESGIRLVFCESIWDRSSSIVGDISPFEENKGLREETLQRAADLFSRWNNAELDRVRVGLAPWSPDTCSPGLLAEVRDLAQRLDTLVSIHLNQTWSEVESVTRNRGMLPTEYLGVAGEGILSDRLICAHCRCMTPAEERLLGQAECNVAFNSAVSARRGLQPRIGDLEAFGCTIGLGTDNMSEDMVEAMRAGLLLERVRRGDGRDPLPEAVLRWATVNGYRMLGFGEGGILEAGKKADLILIDPRKAHLAPVLRVVSDFVHQGQPSDVSSVMVDGRWLMRDGVVLTIDEKEVIKAAQEVAVLAWRRMYAEQASLFRPHGLKV